jgi:hypothetical protein
MLVGNKSDLRHLRSVQTDDAQAYCEKEVRFEGARGAGRSGAALHQGGEGPMACSSSQARSSGAPAQRPQRQKRAQTWAPPAAAAAPRARAAGPPDRDRHPALHAPPRGCPSSRPPRSSQPTWRRRSSRSSLRSTTLSAKRSSTPTTRAPRCGAGRGACVRLGGAGGEAGAVACEGGERPAARARGLEVLPVLLPKLPPPLRPPPSRHRPPQLPNQGTSIVVDNPADDASRKKSSCCSS